MDKAHESQEPVFTFLADPATHGGAAVTRVDTHAAVLFLTPERVFKVKRAVQFPFLDFSTLEKRKAACEAEIDVNRPYAPAIYRGVLAITRTPAGELALGGDGAPVEWAVEMHRFDESQTLDHLADDGKIGATLADALGRAVAKAHAHIPPVEPMPWIDAVGSYIDEHLDAFGARPEVFPADEVKALARESRSAYERIRPLLVERGRHGLIRRIHGDLHLGNIVLIEGQPVLFDAIEFSAVIASGDVLYDLAFLLMDLTERGFRDAANIVLNRYLTETGRMEDLAALAALPFYLSMRAAIRAKVTAARLDQAKAEDRAGIGRDARAYFDGALRFIRPAPPRLVAIGGLSGTGKSVLARSLAGAIAPAPGAVLLRSDVERKRLCGKREDERLPDDAYSPQVTERVYAAICDKAKRVVAAGHSAIVDAVFARPQERALAAVSASHAAFHGVFLTADLATRTKRVGGRRHDASDADTAVARSQEDYDLGDLDWSRVDASGTPADTLARARGAIGVKSDRAVR